MPSALVKDTISLSGDVLLPRCPPGPVGRDGRTARASKVASKRLPAFWQSIHERATDDDRRQAPTLYRMLRSWARHGNVLARLLCAADPETFAAEHGLVGHHPFKTRSAGQSRQHPSDGGTSGSRGYGHHPPAHAQAGKATVARGFHMAASWFRLLVQALATCSGAVASKCLSSPSWQQFGNPSPFTETAVLAVPAR